MFLSVGGYPSGAWQSVGLQGIKSFFNVQLQQFYATSDIGANSPYSLVVSPLNKRTVDSLTVQFPTFVQ
jgi:hypothetical protein